MDKKAFAALPQDLQNSLIRDYGNSGLTALKQLPATASAPYTQAGASQLKGQYLDPTMRENLQGVTYIDKQGNSFIALNPADTDQARTHAHEMEHVLANQGLGHGSQINKLWSQTVDDPSYSSRGNIVKRLVDHAPYLQEKWGLDPKDVEQGYFSKNVLKRPDANNFLYEQLATLSALEQSKNKRLTDDPYVRKHILKTKDERETYNALTGLRQSRLDAKDLPPYTRQDDKTDPSLGQKLKSMLGFANGGVVPNAGNQKLI